MTQLLKMSDLSEMTGVSIHRIRNYLDASLIEKADQTKGGHFLFTKKHPDNT